MLIKEYRIPLPLTLEEYRIAQLYMIQVGGMHASCHAHYDVTNRTAFLIGFDMHERLFVGVVMGQLNQECYFCYQ